MTANLRVRTSGEARGGCQCKLDLAWVDGSSCTVSVKEMKLVLLTCDRIAHDRVRLRNRKTYWMLELALAFGRVAHHVQLLRADLPRWDGQRHSYALCAVQEGLRVAVVEALLEPGGGNEGATHVMPKQKHAGHAEQAPRALAEHRSVLRSGWRRAAARRDLCVEKTSRRVVLCGAAHSDGSTINRVARRAY